MGAIFSLLLVLFLSFCVIRTATAALTLTGLSRDLAWFQSISAFTGVGFTTNEAEHMLTHPGRRRIVTVLMVVGNVGIVTAASSLVLTFSGAASTSEGFWRMVWLSMAVVALGFLVSNRAVDVRLHRVLRDLVRRSGRVEVQDYVDLLHLSGDYSVTELVISNDHWLAGRRLADTRLSDEGVTVLGIQRRGNEYRGVPRGESEIEDGDRLILYGRVPAIEELVARRRDAIGDAAHAEHVDETRRERAERAWADHRKKVEPEQSPGADAPPEPGEDA
jgi:hypothetical protein